MMQNIYSGFLILGCILFPIITQAQEDLMALAEESDSVKVTKVSSTFTATRLVNGHTVETSGEKVLLFLISHRFGPLNSGAYEFFGLDQATIRLALEYGVTDNLTAGIGRSSLEKTYDGFLKYKLLRQEREGVNVPATVTLFSSIALTSLKWQNPEQNYLFSSRLSYTHQLLLARRMSQRLSVQLAPTLVHRNLVKTRAQENNVYAMGAGGRVKITKRTSFNLEYFYLLPGNTSDEFRNALSMGFDIETGGHVFQLIFTNSHGMLEKFFIPQNAGSWAKGDIYFGFNISRVFQLGTKE